MDCRKPVYGRAPFIAAMRTYWTDTVSVVHLLNILRASLGADFSDRWFGICRWACPVCCSTRQSSRCLKVWRMMMQRGPDSVGWHIACKLFPAPFQDGLPVIWLLQRAYWRRRRGPSGLGVPCMQRRISSPMPYMAGQRLRLPELHP